MGKKGGWFSAVRKALIPSYDSKEKKDKKTHKSSSKKSWFGKQKSVDTDSPQTESAFATPALRSPPPEPEEEPKPAEPENEQSKPTKPENEQSKPSKPENEQTKPAYTVAYATARAAEAAAAAAHAAAEVVRLTSAGRFLGKSKEEIAAIKIQTAFRRYLARRKLRALKGLGRLKALVQGQSVKRQATTTLRCMQTLARVQSQVRARRIRMSEENQALQRQLLQKREKELDNMKSSLGTAWENSRRSKEQIDTSIQNKQEAAVRRERALAYAQTHQQMWRNSSRSANPTFMDPNNPHWGWSWLERWMAARPWESQSTTDNDCPPVKSITRSSSVGDISKRLGGSPSMLSPKSPSSTSGRRLGPSSPKAADDDNRSMSSVQPQRNRRHSIASSSFREDSTTRRYISSTKSNKTKSTNPSPSPSPLGSGKKGAVEKKSVVGSVKKRLSFSGATSSGSARRLSGPPKMGSGSR